MHAKFVPYLVRNSLHFCSVFLSKIMVLKVHYFEDHPQNRWRKVHYFEDHPQIAICTVNEFEDHPQTNTQCSMRIRDNDDSNIWYFEDRPHKYSKSCRRHWICGCPTLRLRITCIHFKPYFEHDPQNIALLNPQFWGRSSKYCTFKTVISLKKTLRKCSEFRTKYGTNLARILVYFPYAFPIRAESRFVS